MTWNDTVPLHLDSSLILGHISPSTTRALGQGAVGFNGEIDLKESMGLGGSNQDHSGQFFDNYHSRSFYWDSLLKGFGLIGDQ